ncbi:MAG TPA: hypothetical protein PK156_48570, partial [Polyangium sp.]|nr:hypothetical protein [Polyangium sp.]
MNSGDVIAERFLIERLAGSGGMGKVYQARDSRTGKSLAIKVLGGPGADDAACKCRMGDAFDFFAGVDTIVGSACFLFVECFCTE